MSAVPKQKCGTCDGSSAISAFAVCNDCHTSVCGYCKQDGVKKCKYCEKIAKVTSSTRKQAGQRDNQQPRKKRKQAAATQPAAPKSATAAKKAVAQIVVVASDEEDSASSSSASDVEGEKVSLLLYTFSFFCDTFRMFSTIGILRFSCSCFYQRNAEYVVCLLLRLG